MLTPWIVFLHVIAGSMLIAGNAAALYSTARARRQREPAVILALMRVHHVAVMSLVVPGAIIVLATGLWLAHRLGYPLDSFWIVASVILWVLAFLLGLWPLLPAEARAIATARELVEAGQLERSDALARHIGVGNPLIWLTEHAQLYLMIAFIYLMVHRPS